MSSIRKIQRIGNRSFSRNERLSMFTVKENFVFRQKVWNSWVGDYVLSESSDFFTISYVSWASSVCFCFRAPLQAEYASNSNSRLPCETLFIFLFNFIRCGKQTEMSYSSQIRIVIILKDFKYFWKGKEDDCFRNKMIRQFVTLKAASCLIGFKWLDNCFYTRGYFFNSVMF